MSWFSKPEFSEKGGDLPKLGWTQGVSGKEWYILYILIQSPFSLEI